VVEPAHHSGRQPSSYLHTHNNFDTYDYIHPYNDRHTNVHVHTDGDRNRDGDPHAHTITSSQVKTVGNKLPCRRVRRFP
jgi:hypothetical protein